MNFQTMKQLPLDLKLADYAVFDSFLAGSNGLVLNAVQQAAVEPGQQVIWLWGPTGSGRSHLMQAAIAAAADQGAVCAWLPLADQSLVPGMLAGMGELDLLCVDDVDLIAGDADWERALFGVFEDLRHHSGRLLLTASAPTNEVKFGLPDLASRFASGATWKLQSLTDDELLAALQLRSSWRGLELSAETGQFLLRRVSRSTASLFALLDELDHEAMAEKRRLTVPFV
ncbi:MAG: DnaA regulatory inactivator Hda, partial [Gammaproteobacteria bacterium]